LGRRFAEEHEACFRAWRLDKKGPEKNEYIKILTQLRAKNRKDIIHDAKQELFCQALRDY
jgi:hypothetical protein